MKRKIIRIDEQKCDGCGLCIPNCAEGALQVIDGKARLVSDLFCDGLGACLGYCPKGAIKIEEREAEPYDERKVMDYILLGGTNIIIAHLKHLHKHNENKYLNEAIEYLRTKNISISPEMYKTIKNNLTSCPGDNSFEVKPERIKDTTTFKQTSQLKNFPIQMHLVNPLANYFNKADVILAADCCAYAIGDFHNSYLSGKSLMIACPKLDSNKEVYLEKIITLITESNINSLTVMIMEVPCCRGLQQLVQQAINISDIKIPYNLVIVGINGKVLSEQVINMELDN